MEAGCIAGEMHHGASDAPPRVVAAELDRMRARDDPGLVPVQLVRSRLVADPVLVRIPERPCVEDHHAPPLPGQSLRQDGASGSAPDDHNVDFFVMSIATHVAAQLMVRARPVVRQKPGGLVASPDAVHPWQLIRPRPVLDETHRTRTPRGMPPLGRLGPLRPRDRVLSVALLDLPGLAGAQGKVLVAARIGRAAEADLVPGPGMGVEGAAGVPHPQREEAGGGQSVPSSFAQPHRFDDVALLSVRQLRERPPEVAERQSFSAAMDWRHASGSSGRSS